MDRRGFLSALPAGVAALFALKGAESRAPMWLQLSRDPRGASGGWMDPDGTWHAWREIEDAYLSLVVGEEKPKAGVVGGELVIR